MENSLRSDIVNGLFKAGMIRTWYRDRKAGWILRSGKWSPFYIQLRPLVSSPKLLDSIGQAMANLINVECPQVTKLVGVAMAGIPIAVTTSIKSGISAAYTRKLNPGDHSGTDVYGEHSLIEGELLQGDVVALIDDVVTRFDSKFAALKQLKGEAERLRISVVCQDVCVVVDRLQGGFDLVKREGIRIHSLIQLTSGGLKTLESFLEGSEYEIIADYLLDPDKYQDPALQARLGALSRATRGTP